MLTDAPFQAADLIRTRLPPDFTPRAALILGSGLGTLADQIENSVTMSYGDLPGFPVSGVHGHAGQLVLGWLGGVPVACLKGRSHFYEGHGVGVMTNVVRTMKLIGCDMLFVTCAAGSLREEADAGSLVALTDHINLMPGTPTVGVNDERFGERFFSLSNAYDRDLRATLHEVAKQSDITLHDGVYMAFPGPCFETVAEIRMAQRMGADVVGMSTVPEVISARHCGLKVVAVAAITNLGEGLTDTPLSHEQTLKYAAVAAEKLKVLIVRYLERLAA